MSKVTELLEALMLSFASPFGYDNGVDDGLDAGLDDVDDSIEVVEHGASDEEASEGLTIIKAEQVRPKSRSGCSARQRASLHLFLWTIASNSHHRHQHKLVPQHSVPSLRMPLCARNHKLAARRSIRHAATAAEPTASLWPNASISLSQSIANPT